MIIPKSNISCIYCIENTNNGKMYIGSTVDLKKRIIKHLNELNKSKHHSKYLQRAVNKHGIDSFKIYVLEKTEPDNLIRREQYYLDTLLLANKDNNEFNKRGYNISRIAGSNLGIKRSIETCEKISKAMKGKKPWNIGLTKHNDTRLFEKAEKAKGKKRSKETRENISRSLSGSNNPMYGKKHKLESYKAQCKVVQQFDLDGNHIRDWDSMIEIERKLGFFQSNISKCCNGKKKTYKKYIWKFKKT